MLNTAQYTGAGYLWLSAQEWYINNKPVRSKQASNATVNNNSVKWVTAAHVSNKTT